MYTIKQSGDRLTISLQEQSVVAGIRPILSLDDGTVVQPIWRTRAWQSGEDDAGTYTEQINLYKDAAETLMLTLYFRIYARSMLVWTTLAALKEDQIGVRAKGLDTYAGLRLQTEGLGEVEGLMANYLYKDWWTRPHFDPDPARLPSRTQSLVWRSDNLYHHILCIANDTFKTELGGGESGVDVLTAAYDGGYSNVTVPLFALSSDADPFVLPERNVKVGMAALGTPYQTRLHKRYPEPFEYLGWCSWDAFYRDVSAQGILDKAREFEAKALPVRWLIIDDGWLSHIDTALTAFEPDPLKFPQGFAPLAKALKGDGTTDGHGIWWLGVWHTLFGYWNGIHPQGELACTERAALQTTHTGKIVPAPDVARAFTFWDTWHTKLRNAGVDFVKVDYQSGLVTFYQQELAIGTAAQRAHAALEASVGKSFDNCLINCMGMATENLWHRPTSAVSRNSDDFFPKQPGSFAEHALQNAYNAYYHAPFMWLDWDMWWTRHTHAATHAVLRAVSGGPVYVSDRVGETDPAQLRPLILSDGRLLRCDQPGMITADCLLCDPSRVSIPLKIWSRAGEAGIIATVNAQLDATEVQGHVGPADVPGLLGERFVLYEHFSRTAECLSAEEMLPVTLAPSAAALYSIIPLADPVTPIGLVDKYIAPAAIVDWFDADERTVVHLLDGGTFAWAAEVPPDEVCINGAPAEVRTGPGYFSIDCPAGEGPVWVEVFCRSGAPT